ncbi:MAG: class I SAM-dependent methyltransferase [Geminicoccaceae bacterium]
MTEWDAKGYSERNSLQKWLAQEHLALLELDGTERVLDIGCGDGWITAEIARRLGSGSVLGIDPSTRMIDFAKAHYAEAEYPNLAFAVGDATALPFRREYDLVVSFNALHWVRDQNAALRGIREALKPTGRAFLEFVPEGPRKCLEDVIEETCRARRWASRFLGHKPPYVHLTPKEFRRLASDDGLRVERLTRELKTWDFGSRQGFVDWAKVTFVEWTQAIPEDQRLSFIDDVLDSYGRIDGRKGDDGALFRFYQLAAVLRVV